MKRRIAQGLAVLLGISTLATLLMLGVSLARNPFAVPWVERETEALALRIDRMIATEVDRDWVDTRLDAALAEEPRDWSRINLIQEIATTEKIPPDPALAAKVDSARGHILYEFRRLYVTTLFPARPRRWLRQPRQRLPTAPAVAACDAGDGAKV